jgi:hypothetical protein
VDPHNFVVPPTNLLANTAAHVEEIIPMVSEEDLTVMIGALTM